MNLQKCANGHFYDADKHQTCPHCQQMGEDSKTMGFMAGAGDAPMQPMTGAMPAQAPAASNVSPTVPQGMPYMAPSDDAKTVSIFQSKVGGTQPVVGWLVGIQGECFGQSFPLKEGKNFIGRGEDMDVVIRGDMAVARNRHACLIYEPKAGIFYAQPGESHELFYLNEEVVLNSEKLKNHDVITLGETSLLFVPLCGPDFNWENYRKKDA